MENLDKPTEELKKALKPYTNEICGYWDGYNNACTKERVETIVQGYRDTAPAWNALVGEESPDMTSHMIKKKA